MSDFARLVERTGLSVAELAEMCAVKPRTLYRWTRGETRPHPLAVRRLSEFVAFGTSHDSGQGNLQFPDFRFIDLFAGIGGFRRAFDSIGGTCVFTSEWDKACRTTYQANFNCNHDCVGDIRDYTSSTKSLDQIPQHDVLVAGFPCQPFSIAGVSKKNSLGRKHGFHCDTQGTLFFDLARIIEHHRPAAFLLENVKNLVNHDKGQTFKVIKRTLTEELGYTIDFRVIDSRSWVPQGRNRILIAGFREDTEFRMGDLDIPDAELGPRMNSVLHGMSDNELEELPYFENGKVGSKYTLSKGLWDYLKAYKEKHNAAGNGFGYGLVGPDDVARTLSARYYKDGSEILIRQRGKRPRRLTPRECARLMGFDRPGESNFVIPVSDTQAYKQFGNSVVVPMAVAVAALMKPHVMSLVKDGSDKQTSLKLTA